MYLFIQVLNRTPYLFTKLLGYYFITRLLIVFALYCTYWKKHGLKTLTCRQDGGRTTAMLPGLCPDLPACLVLRRSHVSVSRPPACPPASSCLLLSLCPARPPVTSVRLLCCTTHRRCHRFLASPPLLAA